MNTIVAGVDFGTLSVRVSLFDSEKGRLGSGTADYPLHRKRDDPDHATQSHDDHMRGLAKAVRRALEASKVDGKSVAALAIDTTASSVIPVDAKLNPLDDYYLWCDHRAWQEAAEITAKAHETGLVAIQWSGGAYSSEWGFAKLLHWLRHNPEKRQRFATALEHCEMAVAVLCGITDLNKIPRSICAMGHKWLWNRELGGFPSDEFFAKVDPLLAGITKKMPGIFTTADYVAGKLSEIWAKELNLSPGIPVAAGAIDAHWDAIGAGVKLGDVVNVIGTSTCIMAITGSNDLIPGVCGVVPGSIHPGYTGIEAGLSASGDIFDAIARRANTPLSELAQRISTYRAGQTGLLRFSWDNGDRTVLTNPELGGMTIGWNLLHTAEDELFAAIEGTAFHTRIILERMQQHGTPIHRVINGGGIPQRSNTLNQVYANVLNKPILVPEGDVTSLGSAIFAFLAASTFKTVEEAQAKLCPDYKIYEPEAASVSVYEELFAIYKRLYFGFGLKDAEPVALGDVMPVLRKIAIRARSAHV